MAAPQQERRPAPAARAVPVAPPPAPVAAPAAPVPTAAIRSPQSPDARADPLAGLLARAVEDRAQAHSPMLMRKEIDYYNFCRLLWQFEPFKKRASVLVRPSGMSSNPFEFEMFNADTNKKAVVSHRGLTSVVRKLAGEDITTYDKSGKRCEFQVSSTATPVYTESLRARDDPAHFREVLDWERRREDEEEVDEWELAREAEVEADRERREEAADTARHLPSEPAQEKGFFDRLFGW